MPIFRKLMALSNATTPTSDRANIFVFGQHPDDGINYVFRGSFESSPDAKKFAADLSDNGVKIKILTVDQLIAEINKQARNGRPIELMKGW